MSPFQFAVTLSSFLAVYFLIVSRGTRKLSLPVWASMTVGAAFLVESGTLSPAGALAAVDLRVIGFLFGMFTIVTAMDISGFLQAVAKRLLSLSTTPARTVFAIVFGSGLLSAVLVNDTIALMWTPVVIGVAAQLSVEATPLLIALAFGITIGSVMTPIGNPQNLLVAENGALRSPMVSFLYYLALPTLINLFLIAVIISYFYSRTKRARSTSNPSFSSNFLTQRPRYNNKTAKEEKNNDPNLSRISVLAMCVAIAGFFVASFVNLDFLGRQTGLTFVALVGGSLVYVLSGKRKTILINLDWTILIFFASMFIVMNAVWNSDIGPAILQIFGSINPSNQVGSVVTIMSTSTVLSQILSNVPFVQLYSLVLIQQHIGASFVRLWLALAVGSTAAGNLTVLGAASNIIIVEAAERRGILAFSFFEFFKIGALITAANLFVYFVFLAFL